MTPDFSKAEKMSCRLLGFPPLLSARRLLSLISHGTHLSCPRNRHSCLSPLSSATRSAGCDTTIACERVMRARRHHALPGSFSRGDVRIIRRAARRISPEKLAAKLRLLSSTIARPGFWHSRFVRPSYPRAPPRGLHRCCSISVWLHRRVAPWVSRYRSR